MLKALEAVQQGMSIREAAARFAVPKSTLGDRASGRVTHGDVSGPQKYLTTAEERELGRFLIRCASIGYPKSRYDVISLVQSIIDEKGIHKTLSSGWWQMFCKRNPSITLRAPAALSKARAYASDPDLIARYFDVLEETLEHHNLLGKPCNIFNMDETGMSLDPKSVKCVYKKGEKNPLAPSCGSKDQITVVACVNAAGYCMPPLVILDRVSLPAYFHVGEVPGTKYGLSRKGWIDRELFRQWFILHFLRYAPSDHPLLLLLDGHSSHFCPDTVHLAAEHDIIILVLPPNATHLLQPLDKGIFGPLKAYWKQECHKYMSEHPGEVVSRYSFSRILSQAWERCMRLSNVRAGFKVTGVYPLDRQVALKPFKSSSVTSSAKKAYQPMLSPAPKVRKQANDDGHSDHDSDPGGATPGKYKSADDPGQTIGARTHPMLSSEESDTDSKQQRDKREHTPDSMQALIYCSQTKKFLKTPVAPPKKIEPSKVKLCGRVLTSKENMDKLDHKAKAKEENARLRAEKQRIAAEKRAKKAAKKAEPKPIISSGIVM